MASSKRISREFVTYLALFGVARAMAAFWFKPQYSEFASFHYPFAALSDDGFYPFIHYWLEYPPVFAYLSVGVYRLLGFLWAVRSDPHFQAYCITLQWIAITFDVANAALTYKLVARRHNEQQAIFAGTVFCLSFVTTFVGAGFFDGMVLFFMLLSLWAFFEHRWNVAGASLGLGVATKILPIVLLPALVKFIVGRRALARVIVSFGLVLALTWGSFFLIIPSLAKMPLEANRIRQPWETVWALIEKQFHFGYLGPIQEDAQPPDGVPEKAIDAVLRMPIFSQGANPVMLKLRILSRFSTDLSNFPKSKYPLLYIFASLAVLGIFFITWPRVRIKVNQRILPYSGFLMMLLLLYSKGWSPQFAILPGAFLLICFPVPAAAYAFLGLTVINFIEMPVWLYHIRPYPEAGPAVLSILVALRTAFLAFVAWKFYTLCATRRRH